MNEKNNSQNIIFRNLSIHDIPQLAILAQRAFQHGPDSYWAVVGVKRVQKTIVAEYMGRLIGAIEIEILKFNNEKHGHVGYIFVDPDFQRKGIGSKLLKLAEKWFAERNVKYIWALTTPDNIAAQRFFLKHGYKIVTKEEVFKLLGRKNAKRLLRRMVYWEGDIIFQKEL